MSKKDPIKSIIEALKLNPEGLTLLSLAEVTGLHRHTCTKYVHELIGAGIVYQRDVGAAKLCYLNKEIETEAAGNNVTVDLNLGVISREIIAEAVNATTETPISIHFLFHANCIRSNASYTKP